MSKRDFRVSIGMKFASKKAMAAYDRMVAAMRDIAEDMPWRTDLKDALEDADYVRDHLKPTVLDDEERDT